MREILRLLRLNRLKCLGIEGHAADRGVRENNLVFGQKRADAVRNTLSLKGISDTQIESISFGKEKPVAIGDNE